MVVSDRGPGAVGKCRQPMSPPSGSTENYWRLRNVDDESPEPGLWWHNGRMPALERFRFSQTFGWSDNRK